MTEDARRSWDEPGTDGEIDRWDTALRILLTIVFVLIAAAIETVLTVIVVFELAWALLTRQAPAAGVRDLANRIVAYYYRIGRYLTYNDARPPFPFSEFPDVVEGDHWDPTVRESDTLGIPRQQSGPEDDPRP